jgi:hypothetical protein
MEPERLLLLTIGSTEDAFAWRLTCISLSLLVRRSAVSRLSLKEREPLALIG